MQMKSEMSAENVENCGTLPLLICDLYLVYILRETTVNNVTEENIIPILTLSAVLYVGVPMGAVSLITSFTISVANAAIPAKTNEYPTMIGVPTLEGSRNAVMLRTVAPHASSE